MTDNNVIQEEFKIGSLKHQNSNILVLFKDVQISPEYVQIMWGYVPKGETSQSKVYEKIMFCCKTPKNIIFLI